MYCIYNAEKDVFSQKHKCNLSSHGVPNGSLLTDLILRSLCIFPGWVSVGFCGGRKTREPGKNPWSKGREPTTNSTQIWHQHWELNPGHIGGRRVLSPLHRPCSQVSDTDKLKKFCYLQILSIDWFACLLTVFMYISGQEDWWFKWSWNNSKSNLWRKVNFLNFKWLVIFTLRLRQWMENL